MGCVEIKVLSYADDIALFCSDKKSVTEVLKLCSTFCAATGAAVNLEKCSGLWHGEWATTPAQFEGIR